MCYACNVEILQCYALVPIRVDERFLSAFVLDIAFKPIKFRATSVHFMCIQPAIVPIAGALGLRRGSMAGDRLDRAGHRHYTCYIE